MIPGVTPCSASLASMLPLAALIHSPVIPCPRPSPASVARNALPCRLWAMKRADVIVPEPDQRELKKNTTFFAPRLFPAMVVHHSPAKIVKMSVFIT